METLTKFEEITNRFKDLASSSQPIDPSQWMAGAMKLNVLMEREMEDLIGMEFELAKMRRDLLEKGNTASYTKMMIESEPRYVEVQRQKAKIKNAQDTILLCKKYATLSSDQMRQNL